MVKISAVTDSHGLTDILCDNALSLDFVAWKSKHVGKKISLSLLCKHSRWSSSLIHMQATLSTQGSPDICAIGSILFLWVMLVLLHFFLSLQYCQLLFHLWMTNRAAGLSTLQLSLIDKYKIHILIVCLSCSSSVVARLVSIAIMQPGMLVHNSMAFTVMLIPSISSSLCHSCVWTANPLWIAVVWVCIVISCCTNG